MKQLQLPMKQLRRVWVTAALLAVLSFLLAFDTVWTLFRSGQTAFGAVAGFVGFIMVLLPIWASSLKLIGDLVENLPLPVWLPMLLVQGVLLAAILLGRSGLYSILSAQQIVAGLQAPDVQTALTPFDAALILGGDPKGAVYLELNKTADELDGLSDSRLVTLAHLYVQLGATESERVALADSFSKLVNQSMEKTMTDRATKFARTLAVLDKKTAIKVASESNNAGKDLMNKKQPELAKARSYLEVVRTLDDTFDESERSARQKSIDRDILAGLYELYPNYTEQAASVYREALSLDDSNLEAHYLLSNLLFESGDMKALDEAVKVAHSGWHDYIPLANCRGPQNLSVEDTFLRSWYCFILKTTEAASRRVRSGTSQEDLGHVRLTLVEDAVALAEANGQFEVKGKGKLFTAEAYYELYELKQTETDIHTLCAITRYYNPDEPRQKEWVDTANKALAGRECGP